MQVDGAWVRKDVRRVTLSCDHRAIVGAVGARFLQTVRRFVENPLLLASAAPFQHRWRIWRIWRIWRRGDDTTRGLRLKLSHHSSGSTHAVYHRAPDKVLDAAESRLGCGALRDDWPLARHQCAPLARAAAAA